MAHDVFISYATKDKQIADGVCAAVEARRFRCWIAPRDVRAGMPYGEAIIDAIQGSRVMVVVFSSNANASTHIPKEVECATTDGVTIIPFRVENVVPTKSLNYFLASLHWLDAITTPLEPHLQKLADVIATTLPNGAMKEEAGVAGENRRDSSLHLRPSEPGTRASVADHSARSDSANKTQPWWRRRVAIAIAAVALVVVLAGAAWVFRSRLGGGETINSLAVLPFVNGSGDPNMEYLSDGITESLINSLSQLPHLKVMSRDSAFHYKGKDADAETVGRDLGVRAIFKGRITQQGDNLGISAELIDASDDSHIWGDQYNRKAADIFALQSDIAKEITSALRTRLTGEDEKRLTKSYTANPEAYQDYLKGRYWWNKTSEEGLNKGIEYFQQAIEKDPAYAQAYVGLSDSYFSLVTYQSHPIKEVFPKAKDAALKALQIDNSLAEAHISLARMRAEFDLDWAGADLEFQQAIRIDPSYPIGHDAYGVVLRHMGRLDDSIAEEKRAVELDPLSLINNRDLGYSFYDARQYDKAIEQERKTLELDPNYIFAHTILGWAYLQKTMYTEGIAEFQKGLVISPTSAPALSNLGFAYAMAGRKAKAEEVLDQLSALPKQKYVPPKFVAAIYAALGDKEKAFGWLEKSYQDGSIGSGLSVKSFPGFDPLRADPRFADLLRRMKLTP